MEAENRLIDTNGFKGAFKVCTKKGEEEILFAYGKTFIDFDVVKRALENAPTVDAVEVVHGRWIKHHSNRYECNCCNVHFITCRAKDWNYCPDCGAKMDLEA